MPAPGNHPYPPWAIEQRAEALVAAFSRARTVQIAPPIPLDAIAAFLGLSIDFDCLDDFGYPHTDAALFASQRAILVNEHLDQENNQAQCDFTIAHEIGHWVLHTAGLQLDLFRSPIHNPTSSRRHRPSRGAAIVQSGQRTLFHKEFRESLPPPVCRPSERRGVHPKESEAERFAAALLMPRRLVRSEWHRQFGALPLVCHSANVRTRTVLQLSDQPSSTYIAHYVARLLAPVFKVSPTAMEIRLKVLRLLIPRS